MQKFCLVIPPSIFLLDERVFPSLGILRVAAALEQQGYPVDVLDLSGIANFEQAAQDYAAANQGNAYGITATTPQMPAATKIRHAIEKVEKDAHIVLGGPHPTLVAAAARRGSERGKRALAALNWSQIVAGDGERAICQIARGDRTWYLDADDPKKPFFIGRKEMDEIPEPARHLIALHTYHYKIDGAHATSLIAQLGCPFQCAFCGGRYSPMLRLARTRSRHSIVAEMESIYKTYGLTGFMFYDDELNINGKALTELMDDITALQDKLGVEFRLRGFVKAELFNEEQGRAMYRAGFRWLLTGFESGSPRILENINKRASRDDNTRCVEFARNCGLQVKALMSIGHAGESEETCADTQDWLLEVQPDDFDVTIITTYPGSPYYDDADETKPGIFTFTSPRTGDALHAVEVDYSQVADYYKGDPDGGYQAYVFSDFITSEKLVEVRDKMERTVREKLGIPFNASKAAQAYEHSMGQLPPYILRSSKEGRKGSANEVAS